MTVSRPGKADASGGPRRCVRSSAAKTHLVPPDQPKARRAGRPHAYIRCVSFRVGADEYDRFMGRYSAPLAPLFADFAGVGSSQRVLDVGCGPGALTAELVGRLGTDAVWAVDPSERFVAAARDRLPGVWIERASAEELPYEDRRFDPVLAQLVVHFMADPVAGLREMARVTETHGVVAACVWDHGGGRGPLSVFWDAAREVDPLSMTSRGLPAPGKATLSSRSRPPACRRLRRERLRSRSNTRASRMVGAVHAWCGPRR
jgi:SAM-dependent methyltransferase